MLNEKELGALLMSARDGGSVFRFEGLSKYTVSSDGGDYERYIQGLPGPTMTRKQGWLNLLRQENGRGVHWHRVRLLRPPLSDYERYACEWGYAYNTAAGDECRILEAGPDDVYPIADFWLVDGEQVALMHYDNEGHYLGAELLTDNVDAFTKGRDILWDRAEPFYSWWDRHPEYHRQTKAA